MQGSPRSSLAPSGKWVYCGGLWWDARHCHPDSLLSPYLPARVPRPGVSQGAGSSDAACDDMGRACILTGLRSAPDLCGPTHRKQCSVTCLACGQLP